MNTKIPLLVTGLVALMLIGPGSADPVFPKSDRVLPEAAYTAIVREAENNIASSLKKGQARSTYFDVRVNALVIALAADNRLANRNADRSAADLRDAALALAEGLELHHEGNNWILWHADLNTTNNGAIHAELAKRLAALKQAAERKPSTGPRPVRYRLSSQFTHDDVTAFFGGCGGNYGHQVEARLLRVTRGESAFGPNELGPLELLGYKVALVGELLRDYHDHSRSFTKGTADPRKQWVGLSVDLEQAAWELADRARTKQVETTMRAVHQVNNACVACHQKAGFRHSQ